jgi:hypothetical protein
MNATIPILIEFCKSHMSLLLVLVLVLELVLVLVWVLGLGLELVLELVRLVLALVLALVRVLGLELERLVLELLVLVLELLVLVVLVVEIIAIQKSSLTNSVRMMISSAGAASVRTASVRRTVYSTLQVHRAHRICPLNTSDCDMLELELNDYKVSG